MGWLVALDYFGVAVFAISGALAAARRDMDLFGALVIAFVTALGGGTLRDMALGVHPVSWMFDVNYLFIISATVLLTMLWQPGVNASSRRILLLSDALGLAVFTMIGVQVALEKAGVSEPVAVMMGMMTGAAGGVIRDVICNEIPLIFQREIYAIASAMGGSIYCFLLWVGWSSMESTLAGIMLVFSVRVIAVKAQLALPAFKVHSIRS
ncbi:trimeric intracellular cation channel family protein [Neptunomonas marina]|uniref:Trimeric intracellular cation channel family protein n=1 Tax=Neptunomonas marina TaxID=1815562 RepID=A0A437QCL0_9GAMM|nr:trimeric intracellular cation channel family protein [Neptunomonas marina]RVU32284.1 trimeric intracellular cation channel family protein [Neptunomonas marina]